jgi:hypothetical protein
MVPKVRFSSATPLCFESRAQYKAWREAAKISSHTTLHAGVCTDCTPEYQAQMKAERRCENPHVKFRTNQEGILVGYVDSYKTEDE